jgi:DNA-binding FadR family transcriptional regulator
MAVGLASKHMKPADYDFLKSVIMQMEAANLREDYDALIDLDIQFHSYIWSRTNHLLLHEMLEGMKAQVRYFMYLTRPGDEAAYGSTHQELLDIMQNGDHNKLKQIVSDHILATAERAIERMEIK